LNSIHAMIVDDDAPQRTMLASMLHQLGCTTTEASDPRNALASLRQNPSVSIVFTDVLLPWMNGIHFLERLRKDYPTIPVIVLSASDFSLWGEQALQRGASYCLQIPFFKRDLVEALQAAQVVS
jgi:CheY-like chemotaxis protein